MISTLFSVLRDFWFFTACLAMTLQVALYLPFLFIFLFYSTVCSHSWKRKDYLFPNHLALDEYQQALGTSSILLSADPFLPALLVLLAGFFRAAHAGMGSVSRDPPCPGSRLPPGLHPSPRRSHQVAASSLRCCRTCRGCPKHAGASRPLRSQTLPLISASSLTKYSGGRLTRGRWERCR